VRSAGILSLVCIACATVLELGAFAQAAVTRSGTLQATVVDDLRAGESITRYNLESGGREIPLRPTQLTAEPGDRVVVTGKLDDGQMVGDVEATADGHLMEVAPGPRKVAVLLVRFPGDPAEPWSPEESRSKVFTGVDSANAFYTEESYGAISLTGKLDSDGDVFGWLEIDTPTTGCPYSTWRTKANEAATTAGVDLAGYDHVIYVPTQQSSCVWNGVAGLNATWSFINGNLGVKTIAHELGHNLGLRHAGSRTCTAGSVRVQTSDTCTNSEYGDPFEMQGNIASRHHNGWNLSLLGILDSENVETANASGTYSFESALQSTTEPTILRVPRTFAADGNPSAWYYLEVRETGSFFENVTDLSTTGVSIREVREGVASETQLLDANPASTTFTDAPLGVGQTFDNGPVRVTTLSAAGGTATVSVYVDDQPPSVPAGLTATAGDGGVQLDWDPSGDDVAVDRYVVFRDGVQIATTATTSYLDAQASAGEHDYVVHADDEARNRSAGSSPATATLAAVSGPTCAGATCTILFRYSGAPRQWTVPSGVDEAEFTVEGARGGDNGFNLGARVVATLGPLTGGQEVGLSVGGTGGLYDADEGNGSDGGFNGGGDGTFGSGGGGFSKVEFGPTLQLLAGGGGGRGASGLNAITEQRPNGGSGGQGGSIGTAGSTGGNTTADEATLRGGAGGASGGNGGTAGAGGIVAGTSTCPGGAPAGNAGAAGGSLAGGGGAAGAGGGGGGGYIGGGQGGGAASDACGNMAGSGGGGGGSSYSAPGIDADFTGNVRNGNGQVSIAYSNPVAVANRSYATGRDQKLVVPAAEGVLADAPGGVSLSVVTPPAHGSLDLSQDGSFTYMPAGGYSGSDFFTYRLTDSAGHDATARVDLTVAAPPSAAISSPAGGRTYAIGQAVTTSFFCAKGAAGSPLASCARTRTASRPLAEAAAS
jgi:hypothetical protein